MINMYTKNDVIVSLTSWKDRINTVGKTIFSIYKETGCKIVLTLSTDEFPNKELPDDIISFVDNNILEILWIKENTKCFKKILYTMNKYPDKIIVSADDDCIYNCDYVQRLLDVYNNHPNMICTYNLYQIFKISFGHGPACLYPPNCFKENGLKFLSNKFIMETWHDDVYYGILALKMHIPIVGINDKIPYLFHDEVMPLHNRLTKTVPASIKVCIENIVL